MKKVFNILNKLLFLTLWLATPLVVHASLQLTEILPDPTGDDAAEWIEIFNNSAQEQNTDGWLLTVKTRQTKLPPKLISPYQYLTITKTEANFTLTNTGAEVSLVNPAGETISNLNYGKAPVGQSYSLVNNSWVWNKTPTPGKENNLAAEPKAASEIQSSTNNTFPLLEAKDIYDLKSGARATVRGIVIAAPNEVSENLVFIDGLQLNLTNDSWPEISRGDVIEIKGSASHTKTYGTRLNVKSPDDVKILNQETAAEPIDLKLSDIDESYEGKLIKTTGEVSGRGNNWFTLSADDVSLHVTLKNRESIWPKLSNNNQIEITGLVTLSSGELRLWPRTPEDIILKTTAMPSAAVQTIDLSQTEPTDWRGYIVLVLLGLILFTGWWWQKKKLPNLWQLLKNWIKKY